MFNEDFFERVENLSIALVDLDEKEYTELAALLSLLDPLKDEVKDFEDGALLSSLTAICESIEKLILRDIDPISDPNAVYDSIYLNFDTFKKAVNTTKHKGIEVTDHEEEAIEEADPLSMNEEETSDNEAATLQQESPNEPELNETITPEKPSEPAPIPPEPKLTPPPTPSVIEPDDTDDDLFMDFINEANEYVVTLESLMLDLEQSPNDLSLINEIFRPFHTLKGVSGFMGLTKINHISHEAENILDKARNGKLNILPETSALIFKTIDLIKRILSGLNVKNKIEQASDTEVEAIVLQLSSAAAGKEIPGDLAINTAPVKETKSSTTQPNQTIETTEVSQATPTPASEPQEAAEAPADGARAVKQQEESVRVKTEKLDFLIDMVGELVISYNLFYQDKNILSIFDHEFLKKKSQLHRVISDLQKASLALRMIPISQTFAKMKRVIRDYTAQHKKTIDLILHGEETEIDRNMVDSLYEPLMHMI